MGNQGKRNGRIGKGQVKLKPVIVFFATSIQGISADKEIYNTQTTCQVICLEHHKEKEKVPENIVRHISDEFEKLAAKSRIEHPKFKAVAPKSIAYDLSQTETQVEQIQETQHPSPDENEESWNCKVLKMAVTEQANENQDRTQRECNTELPRATVNLKKTGKIHDAQLFDELCCNILDIEVNLKSVSRLGIKARHKHESSSEEINELRKEAIQKNLENQAEEWEFKPYVAIAQEHAVQEEQFTMEHPPTKEEAQPTDAKARLQQAVNASDTK
ncbi:hypothetical protein CAPTEDRAFT_215263 [Capitella teleta]|uniref:Uncharacterized protein n=1 Tax=Capitella teleta TaxID=283909 RepID=R7VLB6_CAPTE|nr:hypothetical protein CAPTEDRAFT_215263 [Capitella teleta]|eukprot:ELU17485.1 hypothetical protein CAPTEDRAFT_215263 [Capitella teleta]